MRKLTTIALLAGVMALPALADQKVEGDTLLKDLQPAGVANKHAKHDKHQVFDLTFDATGNEYICRTSTDKSTNATDFVVGSNIHYTIDGKKVKISTANNKKVGCTVMRVAVVPATAQ
jgi:hypothetical protein